MAQNITLLGASYSDVPAVQLPKTGGGTARFDDASVTTATASDVASGKVFIASDGTITTGTASGGSDVLVVTLSWDDDYFGQGEGAWVPNKTFAEIQSAHNQGKTIVVNTSADIADVQASGAASNVAFAYNVQEYNEINTIWYAYQYDANGVTLEEEAPSIYPNFESPTRTYTPTTSTQTDTITYDTSDDYNGIEEVNITINAMPSGTEGTPTASKSVSGATATVTPSVTNSAGYISGGTHTGTAVTVTASEVDTLGIKSIIANGTGIDVTGYSAVDVAVPTGGTSPWTKIVSQTSSTISTTSTSAATAVTIAGGSAISTADKIVWVHIRDTQGPRNGYFYGSDAFFVNYNRGNGSTSTFSVPAVICLRYNNDAYAGTAGQYGVYGYSISSTGSLIIRRRYNSSYSLTINSTYKIDVYTLDLPSGLSLFG